MSYLKCSFNISELFMKNPCLYRCEHNNIVLDYGFSIECNEKNEKLLMLTFSMDPMEAINEVFLFR